MTTITWEYHVQDGITPSQLNALGRQGWELVAVVRKVGGLSQSEKAFFKRPLPAAPSPVPPTLK